MRGWRRGAGVIALLLVVACAPDPGVEAERSRPLPPVPVTEPSTSTITTTTTSATTSTTSTAPPATEPPAAPTTAPVAAPTTVPIDPGDPFAALGEPTVEFPITIEGSVPSAVMTIEPLPIVATPPPRGFDGFRDVARMGNGALLATGFDAAGDGIQPEPSGMWWSLDGQRWLRTGLELSAPQGQQSHVRLLVSGQTTYVVGTDLGVATSLTTTERSNVYVARSDDFGLTWTSETIATDAFAFDAVLTPSGVVVLASALADATLRAMVIRQTAEGWEPSLIASGSAGTGADVWAATRLLTVGESLIALGTRNDEATPAATLDWALLPGAENDAAMWRSDDGGATWVAWLDGTFAGVPGSQHALAFADVPGGPLLVVADSSASNSNGPAFHLTAWQYIDGEWRLASIGIDCVNATYLPTVDVIHGAAAPGVTAIVSSCPVVRQTPTMEVQVTLVDHITGDGDSEALSPRSHFEQHESVLEVDGRYWLFGRLERFDDRSDLQIMQLTLTPAA